VSNDDQPDPKTFRPVDFQAFDDGRVVDRQGFLALESSLEIEIDGSPYCLTMQTPGAETELVTGLLLSEAIIDRPDQAAEIVVSDAPGYMGLPGFRAQVTLTGRRRPASTPSVAWTGSGMVRPQARTIDPQWSRIDSDHRFAWTVVDQLLRDLKRHQLLYRTTRGTHAAAMYEADGRLAYCFEDVGRHNALDKVIGRAAIDRLSFADKVLVLSGRASMEMILKVARAGAPLFLCFSNPTVLAVEAARRLNLTLVGRQQDRYPAAFTHHRRLF
jgi:FdhD protein